MVNAAMSMPAAARHQPLTELAGRDAVAFAKRRGEIGRVAVADEVRRLLYAPTPSQLFAGNLQAAFAQPAEYRTVIHGMELCTQRAWTHAGQSRQVIQSMVFAGRLVQALAHPLQKLAIPLGQAAVGHRGVLQRSQGVGQQLRAHAFTHHIA